MTRWTLLAIAFAVVACSEGEKDRVSRNASDAAAGADSALRADPGAGETGVSGGAKTEGTTAVDTAARRADAGGASGPTGAEPAGETRGPTGAEAMGGTRAPTGPEATGRPRTVAARLDLSTDQVRRLQTALTDAGCTAGAADGVVGRRTRQAIACGLEKNNLGSDDLSGLYRALDLDF